MKHISPCKYLRIDNDDPNRNNLGKTSLGEIQEQDILDMLPEALMPPFLYPPLEGLSSCESLSEEDKEEMQEVLRRIRLQIRFIISSIRRWRKRHAEIENSLRLRYSAYEGAMCIHDLRRHWILYQMVKREI